MSTIITWLPVAQDIGATIALIVGAYVALAGLNTWKRQIRANADHDLARRVLIGVYKVRDSMETARLIPERDLDLDYFKDFHQEYLDKIDQARAILDADLLEAEAVWGDELSYRNSLTDFKALQVKMQLASHAYYLYKDDAKKKEEYRSILFADISNLEKDQFSRKLKGAVRQLENVLRTKLRLKNR